MSVNGFFTMMNSEEAFETVDAAVFANKGRHLSDAEAHVFRGAWDGQTYNQMTTVQYKLNYLKQDIGPNLWKLLSDVLGENVGKSTFRAAIERFILKKSLTHKNSSFVALHDQPANTTYQQIDSMLNQVYSSCLETSNTVSKDARRSAFLENYIQMTSKYFKVFSENILDIQDGRIQISGDQRIELIIQLLKQLLNRTQPNTSSAEKVDPDICAISYGDVHRWWATALAKEFTDLNRVLVKRGFHIKRIFIFQNDSDRASMDIVMKWHKLLGIDTYYLVKDDAQINVSIFICKDLFTNSIMIDRSGDEKDGYISINSEDIGTNLARFKVMEKLYRKEIKSIQLDKDEQP